MLFNSVPYLDDICFCGSHNEVNMWGKYFKMQPRSAKPTTVIPMVRESCDSQEKHFKIISLGTGSSGKATIFKQLKYIHNEHCFNREKDSDDHRCDSCDLYNNTESIHVIRQNCVAGILTLLKKSQEIYDMDPQTYGKCLVFITDEVVHDIQLTVNYGSESFSEALDYNEVEALGKAINRLWHLEAVYETWKLHRCGMYSFPANMDYFFNKVTDVMTEKYMPTKEDALKLRLRTTGSIEFRWTVKTGHSFEIIHTGGQRNERKKWVHCFQSASCVISVIGLDHYCKSLFEDEKRNSLLEAVETFDEISKLKYFRHSKIVVILAKTDLFHECLQYNSLKICFGDYYKGTIVPKRDLEQWIRMIRMIWPDINIHIPNDVMRFLLHFCGHLWTWDPAFVQGIKFIKDMILRIRSDTLVYEMCSINTNEVRYVMEDIQKHLINSASVKMAEVN